jgi:dipeptidyl aminopeptidase/acylaminoacyl peptidase
VSLPDGTIRSVGTEPSRDYAGLSKAASTDVIAMTVQDFNTPPDLFLWSRDSAGLRRVTDLNPQFRVKPFCNVEQVSWRSSDGKWLLGGYFLTPKAAHEERAAPLLVFAPGGPTMASASFDDFSAFQYPWPLFLEAGYAVFIPNTRGRDGFGHAFHHAMRDEGSMHRLPAADILSGVDRLIQQKRVDPDEIGIVGWSYGGALASYALIGTQRFKAASIGESIATFLTLGMSSEQWLQVLMHDMYGMGSALEREQLPRLIQESPGYWADRITTPCLLEYGVQANAFEQGKDFYAALKYRNVTSEFIVYPRSGHGWSEPALIADSYRRNLEWFDYWVRGVATERMARRYGKPGARVASSTVPDAH